MEKNPGFEVLDPPLFSYVTLGEILNLSKPQCALLLSSGNNNSADLIGDNKALLR